MRATEFIAEARRNPRQNPKTSINQLIWKRGKTTVDKIAGMPNFFVSFTQIEKLGVNPKSTYDTPLGIYAYPGRYVELMMGDDASAENSLPFAGDQPWANLFSAQGNIIRISGIDSAERWEFYQKIIEVYTNWAKAAFGANFVWKEEVDKVERIINEAPHNAKIRTEGGTLWYVTMEVARMAADFLKSPKPIVWNKLWRALGVDGVIDNGKGIIHSAEPTQAVFFHIGAIKNVERVANKYSYDDVEARRSKGFQMANLIPVFAKMSPEKRLEQLRIEPRNIQYFKNPTKEEQLLAVTTDPNTVRLIHRPSEEAILTAVKEKPHVARFIPNLPFSAQEFLVATNANYYDMIQNPLPEITKYYEVKMGDKLKKN